MKFNWSVILALLLSLAACKDPAVPTEVDQCLRAELFKQCMNSLPAGPASTKYNDWSEVVSECQHFSYYTAIRTLGTVKKECSTR